MRTRFTRVVAGVEIALGIFVILVGAALAIAVLLVPTETFFVGRSLAPREALVARLVAAAMLVGAGVALGAPAIVFGQLVRVVLDMRRRLARIDRRLRRWERPLEQKPESRLIDRLRPR